MEKHALRCTEWFPVKNERTLSVVPERPVLGSLLLNIFSNCLGNGIENLLIKSAEDTESHIFENRTRTLKGSGKLK